MKSLKLFIAIFLVVGIETSNTAQLLPTIGLSIEPVNTATLCYPPYYTGSYYTSGYQLGDTVNDFKLYNLLGDSLILSDELQNGKPVLLIAGSLTCPVFRGKIAAINQVMATYASSISVFVIYTIEAHPTDISVYSGNVNVTNQNINDNILFPNPLTYADRKQMVDTMSDFVSLNAPVFIDGPCNEWWNNFGPAPNNSYLIDTSGIVVSKHGWFNKAPIDNIFCDIDNYLSVTSGSCVTTTAPGNFTVQVVNNISYGTPGQTLYDFAKIINTQSVPVTVSADKINSSLPTSWQTSFCADVCYSTLDDSISFVVNPFDTLLFSLDFFTGPTIDSGKIRVAFRNVNNLSNGVAYWLKASTYPTTGLDKNWSESETVLFYPNPFENSLKISTVDRYYELKIFNNLGQLVDTYNNISEINTETWPIGIYTINYGSASKIFSRRLVLTR